MTSTQERIALALERLADKFAPIERDDLPKPIPAGMVLEQGKLLAWVPPDRARVRVVAVLPGDHNHALRVGDEITIRLQYPYCCDVHTPKRWEHDPEWLWISARLGTGTASGTNYTLGRVVPAETT